MLNPSKKCSIESVVNGWVATGAPDLGSSHSRLAILAGAYMTTWTAAQSEMAAQTRSVVAVGATNWYCVLVLGEPDPASPSARCGGKAATRRVMKAIGATARATVPRVEVRFSLGHTTASPVVLRVEGKS